MYLAAQGLYLEYVWGRGQYGEGVRRGGRRLAVINIYVVNV